MFSFAAMVYVYLGALIKADAPRYTYTIALTNHSSLYRACLVTYCVSVDYIKSPATLAAGDFA